MGTLGIKISKFVTTFVCVYLSSCSADNIHGGQLNQGLKHLGLDKLNGFSEKLQTCGSFFRKEEFKKYFQECVGQHSTTGKNGTLSSSSESEEDDHKKRERRFAPFSESRQQIGELLNQTSRGYWKMFENPHVFKNPCLIFCVLEKFEVINATGHGDMEKIEGRVEEVLAARNKTDFVTKASNIAKKCIDARNTEEDQLRTAHDPSLISEDVMIRAKCRFIIKMGKCIAHNVMMECYDDTNAENNPNSSISTTVSGIKE